MNITRLCEADLPPFRSAAMHRCTLISGAIMLNLTIESSQGIVVQAGLHVRQCGTRKERKLQKLKWDERQSGDESPHSKLVAEP
jgi:hypothetical protein